MTRWRTEVGTLYLLHFDRPYRHAKHYLGWTSDVDARLVRHANGNGSRLCAVAKEAGIGFRLVRTWPRKTRADEMDLKRQHGAVDLCPACRPGAGQGRWPRRDVGRPRAGPTAAGRCGACRGRLTHVAPAHARAHWRHLPPATPPTWAGA